MVPENVTLLHLLQRILKEEFGVEYTLAGVYDLLTSLGAFLPGPATASSEKR